MEIEIAIAVIILLLLVFLATIDMAFTQLSDLSLRKLSSDSEETQNLFLREILVNRPRFRFALSATIQILLIIFSILATLVISNFFFEQGRLLVLSLFLSLFFVFIFRQFIPRVLTWKNPESKLLFLLPFIRPVYGAMSFLSDPLQFFVKAENIENTLIPNRKDDEEETDSDNIQALIEVGEAEGIIEEDDRELIESVFEFADTKVGEIMTPRTEICALPIDATITAARDLIIEEKYSRIPVYRDKIENIEGVIYVRDLLQAWADGKENQKIESLMREAYFIPETKSAAELLKSMQSNHVQIAIVVDEYGGVAGLITVEDIIEEIVGEIEDEDTEQEEVIEIIEGDGGNYFDVLGSTEIHKIERIFDFDLEDDEYTTIAGLVISEVGYVPKKGEKLKIQGIEIEILKADDKRLHLLRLKKASDKNPEPTE
ncbi:MAG: hemolysin family protein [Pyrinomonadaceae bacterium]|nr:hemolysin family protein [Pyrinomonadaceae bacterium]